MIDTFNISPYRVVDSGTQNMPLEMGFETVPSLNLGASKLVARFAQLLLTKKGSDRTDPLAGCGLVDLLAAVHTSEYGFIRSEVNNILDDVKAQMLHENSTAVPLEARFLDAVCDEVSIVEDRILVRFTIVTASNQRLEFVLPVTGR